MFKYKKQLMCLIFFLTANLNAAQYYEIESSNLNQVFSSTFDGLVFGQYVYDDGSFFGNVPYLNNPIFGVNRSTKWEKTGNFDGAGSISFNQNEPEAFFIQLPDIDLSIITSVYNNMDIGTSGLYLTANNLADDGGYDSNYDVGGPISNLNTETIADFSDFNNIAAGETGVITTCTSPDGYCGLAPALSLDLVRFTLEGTPTENGGDNFILRGQTSNRSYLEIEFTTTAVPLPAGIYLFLSGLVGLGLMRSRNV